MKNISNYDLTRSCFGITPLIVDKILNDQSLKGKKILLNIPNTCNVDLEALRNLPDNVDIRVEGGYDLKKINENKDTVFKSGSHGTYHINAVIYSKRELLELIKRFQMMEQGLNDKWSDLQKALYIHDYLMQRIHYDENYEKKNADVDSVYKESTGDHFLRSLRGILDGKSVCAGFALMYKEALDRIGIPCDLVYSVGHAFNVVTIDGKRFGVDLTWDASKYCKGYNLDECHEWFCVDKDKFIGSHIPMDEEYRIKYEKELCEISIDEVNTLSKRNNMYGNNFRDGKVFKRDDGSYFQIIQIAGKNKNGCYQYYYVELDKNNQPLPPVLLLCGYNIDELTQIVSFAKYDSLKQDAMGKLNYIKNVVFSKNNINNCLANNTLYLGGQESRRENYNADKREELNAIYNTNIWRSKSYKRQDGSCLTITYTGASNFNDEKVNRYHIAETGRQNSNSRVYIRNYRIYSGDDYLNITDSNIFETILSSNGLIEASKFNGGYIESINRKLKDEERIKDFFSTDRYLDSTSSNLTSFSGLYFLNKKFDLDVGPGYVTLVDRKTRQPYDGVNKDEAILANLWTISGASRYYVDEEIAGERSAYDEYNESAYLTILSECKKNVAKNGYLDTVEVYKAFEDNPSIAKMVFRLFKSPYPCDFINNYMCNLLKQNVIKSDKTTPFYSENYLGGLLYGDGPKR